MQYIQDTFCFEVLCDSIIFSLYLSLVNLCFVGDIIPSNKMLPCSTVAVSIPPMLNCHHLSNDALLAEEKNLGFLLNITTTSFRYKVSSKTKERHSIHFLQRTLASVIQDHQQEGGEMGQGT